MSEEKQGPEVTAIDFKDDGTCTFTVDTAGVDMHEEIKFEVDIGHLHWKGLRNDELKQAIMSGVKEGMEKAVLAHRVKAAHLPAHVTRAGVGPKGIEGIGGNLAFVLHSFLKHPLSDLSRQGLKSVQFELPFRDVSIVQTEVYTYKDGSKAALTGLEENVFFTLFNDCFIGIGAGPGGRSIIQGDTRRLSKIIGKNAPRVSVLNDIVRNLSRMEFAVPGAGHEVHGRVFPMALCPDENAGQSEAKHLFKFEVSEWIPAALLNRQYETVSLPTFWSIKQPAARRLYVYMKRLGTDGHAPKIETVCERVGLPYPIGPGKENRERRAKSKAILERYLADIHESTEGLFSPAGRTWFIGNKVQWRGFRSGPRQLEEHANKVSKRDEEAERRRLYATMPPEAKAMYDTMKAKGSPKAALDKIIGRYTRAGGHLEMSLAQHEAETGKGRKG